MMLLLATPRGSEGELSGVERNAGVCYHTRLVEQIVGEKRQNMCWLKAVGLTGYGYDGPTPRANHL